MDAASDIAAALSLMLRRGFRSGLYARLTTNVHHALDPSTYPVLSAVAQFGPSSTSAIATRVGLDRSVVSRRARLLVDAGLLRTATNPDDARQATLTLTSTGTDVMAVTHRRLEAVISDQLEGWSVADRLRFARLLRRFAVEGPLGSSPLRQPPDAEILQRPARH